MKDVMIWQKNTQIKVLVLDEISLISSQMFS
jgi:hypothetical protein